MARAQALAGLLAKHGTFNNCWFDSGSREAEKSGEFKMKKLLLFGTIVALAIHLGNTKIVRSSSGDLIGEVMDVVKKYHAAAVQKDIDHLSQLFDENITHFHPGEPYRLQGRESVRRDFEVFLRRANDLNFEMIDPKVQLIGSNVAIVTYYISENWVENGNFRSVSEKATEVYFKRDGRNWSLVHSHYSTD